MAMDFPLWSLTRAVRSGDSTFTSPQRLRVGTKDFPPVLTMPDDRLLHPRQSQSMKVSALTDLEYRVWIAAILHADDKGVLPGGPAFIRGIVDALQRRSEGEISACLSTIVHKELLVEFEHQGKPWLAHPMWQDYQKITYPRRSYFPSPRQEVFEKFSRSTLELFRKSLRKSPLGTPKHTRLTANGLRLTAEEGGESERGTAGAATWGTPAALVALYNQQAPAELLRVTRLSPARKAKAKHYLAAFPDQKFWNRCMSELKFSAFLRGFRPSPGHENFRATFDWLLSKGKDGTENCVKVAEGTYSDKEEPTR